MPSRGQRQLVIQPQFEPPVGDNFCVRVVQDVAVRGQARARQALETSPAEAEPESALASKPCPVGRAAEQHKRSRTYPMETHVIAPVPVAGRWMRQKAARTVQLCWEGDSCRGLPFFASAA